MYPFLQQLQNNVLIYIYVLLGELYTDVLFISCFCQNSFPWTLNYQNTLPLVFICSKSTLKTRERCLNWFQISINKVHLRSLPKISYQKWSSCDTEVPTGHRWTQDVNWTYAQKMFRRRPQYLLNILGTINLYSDSKRLISKY